MSPARRRSCRTVVGSLGEGPCRGLASCGGRNRIRPPKTRWRERPRVSSRHCMSLRRVPSRLREALRRRNEVPGAHDVLWRRRSPGFDVRRLEESGRSLALMRTCAHLCEGPGWGTPPGCPLGQPLRLGVRRATPPAGPGGRYLVLRLNGVPEIRALATLAQWIFLAKVLVLSCRKARTSVGKASRLVVAFQGGGQAGLSLGHSRRRAEAPPTEQSANQRTRVLARDDESAASEARAGGAASRGRETEPEGPGRRPRAPRRTARLGSRGGPRDAGIRAAGGRPSQARPYARTRAHGLGQPCGWAGWCVRTVVMLALWASVARSHAHQDANVCQQKYNRTADQSKCWR